MAHSIPSRTFGARSRANRDAGLIARLIGADALFRQRRALARLEPHALADIGLDAGTAACESARPAWDAPGWWR